LDTHSSRMSERRIILALLVCAQGRMVCLTESAGPQVRCDDGVPLTVGVIQQWLSGFLQVAISPIVYQVASLQSIA